MYRQKTARKKSSPSASIAIKKATIPTSNYGYLSETIQRATANPKNISQDEWLQLNRVIGTKATNKFKSGKSNSFVPKFTGISTQLSKNNGQNIAPIQAKKTFDQVEQNVFFRQKKYNPGSPREQQLIDHKLTHVVQQNGGIVQRTLETKDNIYGTKIRETMEKVKAKVDKVIQENKQEEILKDIAALEKSIKVRNEEQKYHSKKTENYQKHEHRIKEEEEQLERLINARQEHVKNKPAKPPKQGPDEDGWITK